MLGPLRLLLHRAAATSLVLLPLLSHATAEDFSVLTTVPPVTTTCKRLTDADSPFVSALSLLASVGGSSGLAVVTDPSVFASLDQSLPTLSQCLAETKPLALLSSLAAASPQVLQCLDDVATFAKTPLVGADGKILFGDAVCPAFAKLAPCLTDVLLPELEKIMAKTNGCCAPLLAQMSAGLGAPLTPAVTSFVHIVGNAFCSQRSSLATPSTSENCGDSLMNNWLPLVDGEGEKEYWNLLNSFQIPNDQTCTAARGEPFQTTTNQTQQFGASEVKPFGLCWTPLDALQQYVQALPFWKVAGGEETATMVDRVFTANSCLPGKDFLAWATADDAAFMRGVRMVDDLIGALDALTGKATNATTPSVSPAPAPEPTTEEPTPTPTSEPTTEEPPVIGGTSPGDDSSSNDGETAEDEPAMFDLDEAATDGTDMGATLEDLTKANWTEIVRAKLWELDLVTEPLCFHIPNGVPCSFPGDLLSVPFPQFTSMSLDSGDGSGTTPSPSNAPSPSTSPGPGPVPQPSAAGTTPSPTAASNSSSTNSSSTAGMRQHQGSVLTAIGITMVTAFVVHLL